MIEQPSPFVVEADWLVPVDADPIWNGFLVIQRGRIEFVGNLLPYKYHSARHFKLAGFAILPGLVNSHCHLEFSDLAQPILAGDSFPDWIGRLLAYRRLNNDSPEKAAVVKRQAIASGIRESYEAGVRWIIDMTTEPFDPNWIDHTVDSILTDLPPDFAPERPITIQPCIEIVDITERRFKQTFSFATEQARVPESAGRGRMGLAPHAPYTASSNVTRMCSELSQTEHRLVSMHLAESLDEMEWLRNRTGRFSPLLSPILPIGYFDRLCQVSDHMQLLTQAWRSTIAHGNYLSQRELSDLATCAERMAIVHCPRTHGHFGHHHDGSESYPLSERIALGVRHFLGTDSRASNPDLNLWREAQLIRAAHPSISSIQILKMITTDASSFLGIADNVGSIGVGRPSSLTAIKLSTRSLGARPTGDTNLIYDAILDAETTSAPLERVLRWDVSPR